MQRYLTIAAVLFLLLGLTVQQEAAPKKTYQYNFSHESFDHAKLKQLRETYDFAEYAGQGKTEYEKMVLLKDWVYSQLLYSFKTPYPDMIDSFEILKLTKEKKTRFLCTSYASLYLQCALSMGWTARFFFLRRPAGNQHIGVDVWSAKYNKWIYIDPTWNIHTEENGIPLSLLEIRQKWLDKSYDEMKFIFSAGEKTEWLTKADFPIRKGDSELWTVYPIDEGWLAYSFEIALIGRNNFFENGNLWASRIYILKDKHNENDKYWLFRNQMPLPVNVLFGPLDTTELRK